MRTVLEAPCRHAKVGVIVQHVFTLRGINIGENQERSQTWQSRLKRSLCGDSDVITIIMTKKYSADNIININNANVPGNFLACTRLHD